VRINSAYDASISCENFVKFGAVTPEMTELVTYESALHADDGSVPYLLI